MGPRDALRNLPRLPNGPERRCPARRVRHPGPSRPGGSGVCFRGCLSAHHTELGSCSKARPDAVPPCEPLASELRGARAGRWPDYREAVRPHAGSSLLYQGRGRGLVGFFVGALLPSGSTASLVSRIRVKNIKRRLIFSVAIKPIHMLQLNEAILEGGNQFKKVHGVSIFEYMNIDSAYNNTFNKAMDGLTTIVMNKILEFYQGFEGLTTLVDVAGGTGKCLNMIISKYPSIVGINFDLPHVIESAPAYSGIQHVGGSMFSTIPRADAIMIKNTLHNWNDENCIKILRNCYEALLSKGKVVVMDLVLPEAPETSATSMYTSRLDNTMLMHLGGQERTEREFRALAKAAGFSEFKVACVASELWVVMELYK
ncbi:caffeic acid 3-O-methyltransferase-like isoform X1 [Rhodamnia argentea]|uniref:Caffeic acid 3-O-methyltransferase-like isoform X1 n=1 Tax=Rhodamnia argentea TaxID=178133 RepID=A0ABM3H3Q6_9MYRT|nr:caffeic acid 3-O-methyltransferase-like isoform X1 [Rhodamnia argentea]